MKIGVVGLGLIGGSIFKGLQEKGFDIIGVSASQNSENIYKNYDVLKDCEVIFVCSAMNKTLGILDELEKFLSEENLVTDVCSLITRWQELNIKVLKILFLICLREQNGQ